uniref:Ubiquitin-like 1-activating enzyme E1A n=1 Tax=Ganoderma boninense TaxID=34458 RepID=A0A5K1JVS6_9APHY|nr:Mannitol dehydrogenase [Ganoderma boninense]
MRNATILMVRLRGVATEAIKNIVLAGIGKLVVADPDDVEEQDLGAGFFYRDEDVGKKRVDAAKARIESLNPLVAVETQSDPSILKNDALDTLLSGVDMVCVTDVDRATLIRLNDACRRLNKPFYSGGTYGLLGYIFCDLLKHDYIAPDRSAQKDAAKNVKNTVLYSPLQTALQHRWTGMTRRQTKEVNPAMVFSVLAAPELEAIANKLIADADVNKQVLPSIPKELLETVATTAAHELSPVCAVVGGLLAQDILKALAAREPPIANFFTFDGNLGGGTVVRMSMP